MVNVIASSRRFIQTNERSLTWVVVTLAFVLTVFGTYSFFPMGVDWHNTYRPAALQVLALKSPYTVTIYHSPPWAILPILPIALLPARAGFAINFALCLTATAFVAYRLKAKPLALLAILLSYPVLFMGEYGQIDWLIYLGFILPPQWGLFFVLIKPQASIGIIIFWLVEALREGGVKKALFTFLPVTAALLLSFVIFGNWFQSGLLEIGRDFNASLWPQSIPIGLVLLAAALRQRRANLAIVSSPFLSPYLAPHSWGVALLGLSPLTWETLVASAGLWILRFMTGYYLH